MKLIKNEGGIKNKQWIWGFFVKPVETWYFFALHDFRSIFNVRVNISYFWKGFKNWELNINKKGLFKPQEN